MKKILFVILLTSPIFVYADHVNAYCKFFDKSGDKLISKGTCEFSQYQGHIYLTLPGDKKINLSPKGELPGNFTDSENNAVYRKKGLGKKVQIYQFKDKLVYIYWDKQQLTDKIKIKPIDYNTVAVDINDTGLTFQANITRQIDNVFTGIANQNIIVFNSSNGQLLLIDKGDGKVIKTYQSSPIPTFENPDAMCNPKYEPC